MVEAATGSPAAASTLPGIVAGSCGLASVMIGGLARSGWGERECLERVSQGPTWAIFPSMTPATQVGSGTPSMMVVQNDGERSTVWPWPKL